MAWDSRRRRIAGALSWHKRGHHPSPEAQQFHVPSFDPQEVDPEVQLSKMLSPVMEEGFPNAHEAPLEVKVTIRFLDHEVRSVCSRSYTSSQLFEPTERICKGLLRRIEHCSEELITRKDSDALNQLHCIREGPKHLRFDMHFRIYRKEKGLWAEQTFRSYQKQPLTAEMTHDVARSTHRTIGLFLRRYDEHFQWIDEPYRDLIKETPALVDPSPNGPLTLASVPRSQFIESSQTWEFVPGYTLQLSFRSDSRSRQQREWRRTLRVSSKQSTPLNLGLGESMLWQAGRAVQNELDMKKEDFDREHESYDGFEGIFDPQYFEEDVLDISLRIMNNLGPAYTHLSRSFQSKLRLFSHPQGEDCAAFLRSVQAHFVGIRDKLDTRIKGINDFDFRILELRGRGWEEKNSARFTIDGTESFSRQSVQAMLDRIHTSIVDILHGHDIAIHIVAHKRGHLILDKALVAHEEEHIGRQLVLSPEQQKEIFYCRLRAKIQAALDCLCRDTLSIDDIPEDIVLEVESEPAVIELETEDHESSPAEAATPPSPNSFIIDGHRVFPLIPAKYEEHLRLSSAATSVRNSVLDLEETTTNAVDSETVDQKHLDRPAAHAAEEATETVSEPNHTDLVIQDKDEEEEVLESKAEVAEAPSDFSISEAEEEISEVHEPALSTQESTNEESTSSRPSTPGLSSGGTPSPRNSLLFTPTFLRTLSGTQEPLITDSDISSAIQTPGPSVDVERFNFNLVTTKKSNESQLRDGNYPTPPESEVASVDMESLHEREEPEHDSDETEKATTTLIEDASISGMSDLSSFSGERSEFALDVPETVSNTEFDQSVEGSAKTSETASVAELEEPSQPEPDNEICDSRLSADDQEPDARNIEDFEDSTEPETEHVERVEELQLVDDVRSELSEAMISEPETATDLECAADVEARPASPVLLQEDVDIDNVSEISLAIEPAGADDSLSELTEPSIGPELHVTSEAVEEQEEQEYQSFPELLEFDGPIEFVEDPSRSKVDFFEDDEADIGTEPETLPSSDEPQDLITENDVQEPEAEPETLSLSGEQLELFTEECLAEAPASPESAETTSGESQDIELLNTLELSETEANDKMPDVFEVQLTETIVPELPNDDKPDVDEIVSAEEPPADNHLDDSVGDVKSDDTLAPASVSAEIIETFSEVSLPAMVCDASSLVNEAVVEAAIPSSESASIIAPELETVVQSESDVVESATIPPPPQSQLLPPLATPSCRSSVSSWEDYESAIRTSKDSVDTIVNPDDPVLFPPPGADSRFSRPTTGYLGLHEERLVEVGLRGALVGPNRGFEVYSDSRPATAPSVPSSPNKVSRVLRLRKRSNSAFKSIVKSPKSKKGKAVSKIPNVQTENGPRSSGEHEKENEQENEKGVLPRMMMLFAGMAIASQVVNKSR